MVPMSPSTHRKHFTLTHLLLCKREATAEMACGGTAGLAGRTDDAHRKARGVSSRIWAMCPSKPIAGRPSSLY